MNKIIIILIIFFSIFGFYSYIGIGEKIIEKQEFVINKGDTISGIPNKIGISVNGLLYKIWIKLNYNDYNLKAGTYEINKTTTLYNLFKEVLSNPNSKDVKVTILPGWNIFDVDAYLADNGIIKKGEIISFSKNIPNDYKQKYDFLSKVNSVEGFIYPDTYRLPVNGDISNFLNIVLDEFNSKIYSKYGNDTKFYNNLILASILEREEKNVINKSVVAGVLKKRLSENIALGADATVCYSYELTQKQCTPTFIGNYIYKKSTYNTRSKVGLPPTPISNFTNDTIDAVINSKNSPYYYYLHDMNGNIYYGRTLEEHNRNKLEYLN